MSLKAPLIDADISYAGEEIPALRAMLNNTKRTGISLPSLMLFTLYQILIFTDDYWRQQDTEWRLEGADSDNFFIVAGWYLITTTNLHFAISY